MTDLRDSLNSRIVASNYVKNLVLDIARELQMLHICEKWQSSSVTKKVLDDEINEGLITARWIHEVLPGEFKRGHRKHLYEKWEVNSLSSTLSPLLTNNGAQINVQNITSSKKYVTLIGKLSTSLVSSVCSRNLSAGQNETLSGL